MSIKIGQENRVTEKAAGRGRITAKLNGSFSRTLAAGQEHLNAEALKTLMRHVDEQAARVSGSRTVHDLQLYKKLVRSFMQEAVRQGLDTERFRSWQNGGARQTLVRTVDKKLMELTHDLLDKNKKQLDLLDRLDEIRGMLINLYI
ncbi:YaaR family protein [Sporolactobacillus sp. Y61]|uniref:YaaR family protein n=1 Tax=Sporolactobacillus sp. Y61 TaxID=3160863 RepID=A0AAU8IGW9_9BACL|nr:YaaR family protein [Sporolactobacillus sp. THM19-2]